MLYKLEQSVLKHTQTRKCLYSQVHTGLYSQVHTGLYSQVHTGDKVEFNTVDFVESRQVHRVALVPYTLATKLNSTRSTLLKVDKSTVSLWSRTHWLQS